jgi:formylglycine-generating enzyme required for sulfatase activity
MVGVPVVNVCIDRYEASRGPDGRPVSVQGALPWAKVTWDEAKAACEAAGKRLCSADEWTTACQAGPEKRVYPYGNDYKDSACNTGDHKRWHEKHNCQVDDDGNGPNALHRLWHAMPTGSHAECEGGLPGLFDMSGNVAEWTSTCEGDTCRLRSSGYYGYAAGATQRCEGGYKLPKENTQTWSGFRCCRAP